MNREILKKQKGFSLFELLISLSVLTVFIGALSTLFGTISGGDKSSMMMNGIVTLEELRVLLSDPAVCNENFQDESISAISKTEIMSGGSPVMSPNTKIFGNLKFVKVEIRPKAGQPAFPLMPGLYDFTLSLNLSNKTYNMNFELPVLMELDASSKVANCYTLNAGVGGTASAGSGNPGNLPPIGREEACNYLNGFFDDNGTPEIHDDDSCKALEFLGNQFFSRDVYDPPSPSRKERDALDSYYAWLARSGVYRIQDKTRTTPPPSSGFANWSDVPMGTPSFGVGQNVVASGSDSFSFGRNTVATGADSIAIGQEVVASGDDAIAIGWGEIHDPPAIPHFPFPTIAGTTVNTETTASGTPSIAIGRGNIASGNFSVAIGGHVNHAQGNYSAAFGMGSIASEDNQVVFGLFNDSAPIPGFSSPLIIGNGKRSDRSNALRLKTSGSDKNNGTLVAETSGGRFFRGSDIRLKENLEDITAEKLNAFLETVAGKSYEWIGGNGEREMGFIAQDVEKVFPELVQTNPEGIKSLDYEALVAPMLEILKEHDSELENLRTEFCNLRPENNFCQ